MSWLQRLSPAGRRQRASEATRGDTSAAEQLAAPAAKTASVNDAAAYGVQVEPAAALPGTWCWRATEVHHLTPEENNGRHHIDVDVLQEVEAPWGERVFRRLNGARVRVFWEGGEQIVAITGQPGEVGASQPLWRETVFTVEALGLAGAQLPSDRVTGIHIGHPDEGRGNSHFHHSFSITFRSARVPLRESSKHPLAHYVLFGPAEQPATQTSLWLAQDYLIAFQPAFGFSPDEASRAAMVTIVADAVAVSAEVQQRLAADDIIVERIAGSAGEVARMLADRIAQGERVLGAS